MENVVSEPWNLKVHVGDLRKEKCKSRRQFVVGSTVLVALLVAVVLGVSRRESLSVIKGGTCRCCQIVPNVRL